MQRMKPSYFDLERLAKRLADELLVELKQGKITAIGIDIIRKRARDNSSDPRLEEMLLRTIVNLV